MPRLAPLETDATRRYLGACLLRAGVPPEDLDDATADATLRLLRAGWSPHRRGAKGYLGAAVLSVATARRQRPEAPLSLDVAMTDDGEPLLDLLPDDATPVADRVADREELHAALARLEPADARLLRRVAAGWTVREAAEADGCSAGWASRRMAAAREQLEQELAPAVM